MNPIYLTPYIIVENKDYPIDTKIVVKPSDFKNVSFQDGKITFSFISCRFRNLEIENDETIDFKDISIQFISCFLGEINIDNFVTPNFSIFFGSSILQGRIKNENLKSVTVNNCLLYGSIFLLDLKKAIVLYNEENVFPIRWKKLLKSVNTTLEKLQEESHSYYIYDCKDIVFTVNENSTENQVSTKGLTRMKLKTKLAIFSLKKKRRNLKFL